MSNRSLRSFTTVVACATVVSSAVVLFACRDKGPMASPEQAPPPKSSASVALGVGDSSYVVQSVGNVSVLIDAPLEKFKGETTSLGGFLRVNPMSLKTATGTITANLEAFKTHTFGDKDKDETQTEHVHNWFEIGDDVKKSRPKDFENYRDVVFKIETIDESSAISLKDVKEVNGGRTVTMKVSGTIWVHSRPARKQVVVEITFKGPAEAPTEIVFKTKEPLKVSLATHDVKPRDTTGKFLDGALAVVGKKIDDTAQVTVEATAKLDATKVAAASASASASAMIWRLGTMTPSAMPSIPMSAAMSAMPPMGAAAPSAVPSMSAAATK